MFVGHYSASLVAKRWVPQAPLWLLMMAAQLVDIFWAAFLLTGVERGRIVAGFTRSNPLDLYYMPFTHSLPAAVLWSIGAGLLVFALYRSSLGAAPARAVALAVACVVASHWVLDWLVHKPDLGLWGNQYKVGLGLWDYLWPSLALEYGLLLAAALYVYRDAALWRRVGGGRLLVFLLLMALIHLGNVFGRLPPSMLAVGVSGLAIYLIFAAVAAWLERRELVRV
jgi:hypothetical protein